MIKKLMQGMKEVGRKYGECGAGDTEPETAFEYSLFYLFKGIHAPEGDVDYWGLFSDGTSSKEAVKEFNMLIDEARVYIPKMLIENRAQLVLDLKEYCWRINLYESIK